MGESYTNVTEGSGKKQHSWQRTIGANNVEDSFVLLSEPPYASYICAVGPSVVSSSSHLLQLMAGSSLKVRVRRIDVWQQAAVTTGVLFDIYLLRVTTAGTGGTAVTPTPLDPSDAASGATVRTLPTGATEGLVIDRVWPYAIQTVGASTPTHNPLVTWDFDRPRSKPLIIAAGTSNGIVVKNNTTAAAGGMGVTVWFDETAW